MADYLRICLAEPSQPFVCEARGRVNGIMIGEIESDLADECPDDIFDAQDDEWCCWVSATWNLPQYGDEGRLEMDGYWDLIVRRPPDHAAD